MCCNAQNVSLYLHFLRRLLFDFLLLLSFRSGLAKQVGEVGVL